jgi:hypothetical protein
MEVKIGKGKAKKYHGQVSKPKLHTLIVKHLKDCGIDSKCITQIRKSEFIEKLWNDLEGDVKKERKATEMTPARKAHIERMRTRGKLIAKLMKDEGKTLGEASKLVPMSGGKKITKKVSKKVSKKASKKVTKKKSKKSKK